MVIQGWEVEGSSLLVGNCLDEKGMLDRGKKEGKEWTTVDKIG